MDNSIASESTARARVTAMACERIMLHGVPADKARNMADILSELIDGIMKNATATKEDMQPIDQVIFAKHYGEHLRLLGMSMESEANQTIGELNAIVDMIHAPAGSA